MAMGTIAALAAVGSLGYQVYSGERAASAQAAAQDSAVRRANANQLKQQQQFNKANKKRPNTMNAIALAQQSAKGGQSGTMLTGQNGAAPSSGQLGKSTLLGG